MVTERIFRVNGVQLVVRNDNLRCLVDTCARYSECVFAFGRRHGFATFAPKVTVSIERDAPVLTCSQFEKVYKEVPQPPP